MTSPKFIPCPACRGKLTSEGCVNRTCVFGVGSGYTVPPPPVLSEVPDPFPATCPTCGQPLPK